MKHRNKRGFTLVELLVVIGIIGLLVSLLLPALNKARRAANTVTCLANLRSCGQGMMMYVAQNNGFLPGSGLTSGRGIWADTGAGVCNTAPSTPSISIATYAPMVNECEDWMGPLARVMGFNDPRLLNDFDPITRYAYYMSIKAFQCPSYIGAVATAASGSSAAIGTTTASSYVTALAFLTIPNAEHPGSTSTTHYVANVVWIADNVHSGDFPLAPVGYFPKISKVGSGSRKIFMADGFKGSTYSKTGGVATLGGPKYTLTTSPANTGSTSGYSDWGAFYGGSSSFHRECVPGNCTAVQFPGDGRLGAYRHGAVLGFGPAGTYRLNVVFFDGHGETLDDMTASNPDLWLPRGSYFANTNVGATNSLGGVKTIWADYQAKFIPGPTYTVN